MKLDDDFFPCQHEEGSNLDLINDFLFVIVLYGVAIEDSLTFNSLSESVKLLHPQLRVDLLICDNSLVLQDFSIASKTNSCYNIYYLHDSSNPGISASYNKAAEFASMKRKKWILVMDQDTIFPNNALSSYLQSLRQSPNAPLYAPKVFDTTGLMLSPCAYNVYRGSPLRDVQAGVNSVRNRNIINSGLLLNLEAYRRVGGYDENVWLYFSDFIFFNRLTKYYKSFVVVDCKLTHELSSSDYTNYEFAAKRFSYYCEGAKAASLCDTGFISYLSYRLTVGSRSLLMTWRFKNINFLKTFSRNFF